MKTRFVQAAIGVALVSMLSCAVAAPTSADKGFLNDAAQGNMAEVSLGKLATQHGLQTKDLGRHMIEDHTKMEDQVSKVARQEKLQLPTGMNSSQQRTYDKLSKLKGKDFDKAYTDEMVTDHKNDIAAFQKELKATHDSDIKTLVSNALPIIQSHLSMFNTEQAKLGGNHTSAMQPIRIIPEK